MKDFNKIFKFLEIVKHLTQCACHGRKDKFMAA